VEVFECLLGVSASLAHDAQVEQRERMLRLPRKREMEESLGLVRDAQVVVAHPKIHDRGNQGRVPPDGRTVVDDRLGPVPRVEQDIREMHARLRVGRVPFERGPELVRHLLLLGRRPFHRRLAALEV